MLMYIPEGTSLFDHVPAQRKEAEDDGRHRALRLTARHVIAEFEAAKSMPWDEAARASARVLVSNLTRWLPEPEEEHETLRAAFGAARFRHMVGTAYLLRAAAVLSAQR